MRFSEFCSEDYLKIKEEIPGAPAGDDMTANIASVLQLLKRQADSDGSGGKINTQSFIKLVQNTGYKNFGYDDLVAVNDDPSIKNLIKSFNKDNVIVNLSGAQPDDQVANKGQANPEKTVSAMAKHSLNRN